MRDGRRRESGRQDAECFTDQAGRLEPLTTPTNRNSPRSALELTTPQQPGREPHHDRSAGHRDSSPALPVEADGGWKGCALSKWGTGPDRRELRSCLRTKRERMRNS